MTIDEATALLSIELELRSRLGQTDRHDAIRLGIEALELIQRERLLGINPVETRLPGETQ